MCDSCDLWMRPITTIIRRSKNLQQKINDPATDYKLMYCTVAAESLSIVNYPVHKSCVPARSYNRVTINAPEFHNITSDQGQ